MLDSEQRRAFVRERFFCVWGYNRKVHGPAMSIGYYTMDGDDICFLTMEARAKAKAAARDPRASVCVIDWGPPPEYVLVYGTVKIERDPDYVADRLARSLQIEMINEGNKFDADDPKVQRAALIDWVRTENRVVLRLTPESTFYSPATRGKNAEEKWNFRKSLGEIEDSKIRIGSALPW
jgi:hypothetical protein